MSFDGQQAPLATFTSGLPQGSPLSPVSFIIHAGAVKTQQPTHPAHSATSYVDDEVIVQGATSQKNASALLQKRLDESNARVPFLNINTSPPRQSSCTLFPTRAESAPTRAQ